MAHILPQASAHQSDTGRLTRSTSAGQGANVHITVIGASGTADSRTRAYVQHRVSDGLRALERQIRAVDVSLFHQSHDAAWGVSCTVTVEFRDGHRVVVTTAAEWPYAAIDKAVEQASRESVFGPPRVGTIVSPHCQSV